jgi:hypothetical protein
MRKSTLKYFSYILIQREKGNDSRLPDDEKDYKELSIYFDSEEEGK